MTPIAEQEKELTLTGTEDGTPIFPLERSGPVGPRAEYSTLRESKPVSRVMLRNGEIAWAITGHKLVRQILSDPRVSSDRSHPGCPRIGQVPRKPPNKEGMPLLWLDPPDHTTHRRMVTNEFTMKRVQDLRPRVQTIVDDCIDEMLAGGNPADLIASLAVPVPSRVICELLGISYNADRERFQHVADVIVDSASTQEQVGQAFAEVRAFLGELVTAKEKDPQQDLLSRMIVKYQEADIYQPERIISTAMTLLNAGHETTAGMIGLGTLVLLQHPSQITAIKSDPGRTSAIVEELLRYLSTADLVTVRTATADIEVNGVTIRKGEGLLALCGSANHDPAQFPAPHEFDPDRNTAQHVAFGFGIHQCLGQNLARLELEVVFRTLFTRVPGLRLSADMNGLPYKGDAVLYGVRTVPVTW